MPLKNIVETIITRKKERDYYIFAFTRQKLICITYSRKNSSETVAIRKQKKSSFKSAVKDV